MRIQANLFNSIVINHFNSFNLWDLILKAVFQCLICWKGRIVDSNGSQPASKVSIADCYSIRTKVNFPFYLMALLIENNRGNRVYFSKSRNWHSRVPAEICKDQPLRLELFSKYRRFIHFHSKN